MEESTYVETDSNYGNGAALDIYKDRVSVVAAGKSSSDGRYFLQWVHPTTKDRDKPSLKVIPVKVTLGDTGTAIKILKNWIDALQQIVSSGNTSENSSSPKKPETLPEPVKSKTGNVSDSEPNDVPF